VAAALKVALVPAGPILQSVTTDGGESSSSAAWLEMRVAAVGALTSAQAAVAATIAASKTREWKVELVVGTSSRVINHRTRRWNITM
jgi:hypothetical protein